MAVLASVQTLILWGLSLLALGIEVFALVDAARTRPDAFEAAGKQTKRRWLLILGVSLAVGILTVDESILQNILAIVAVIAAAVYLTDVRPAVRQIRGGGQGRGSGPYGPW